MRAFSWVLLGALLLPAAALAQPDVGLVDDAGGATGLSGDPATLPQVPQEPPSTVKDIVDPTDPNAPTPGPGQPDDGSPGFGDQVRAAFHDQVFLLGLGAVGLATVGVAGFAFVTRYISPKEALKNPQRAMLFGFIKGNPGIHLKKLSEEFHMKTSSILWHIRKLESAELVRSERANGFRVFYPTEGGLEVKKVGRAVTALQNANARQLFERLQAEGPQAATPLASGLAMHVGTARWHLKKLVEFGLVEELPGPDGATVFVATPLGTRAMASLAGPMPQQVPAIPA